MEGSFESRYAAAERFAARELTFNVMAHGRYDVGITYILVTPLKEE
jgi:hypothetical protein